MALPSRPGLRACKFSSKAASMSHVLVGENKIPRDLKRYFAQFSMMEIDCDPGKFPGKGRIVALAEQAPEGFVFSVVVPSSLASLEPTAEDEKQWLRLGKTVEMLRAKYCVVRTPASVRPTSRSRRMLTSLFARLQGMGAQVAWEAGGVWDDADVVQTANELGVVAVQDISRTIPLAAPALYARVLALGRGSRVGMGLAEQIAERAVVYPSAVVVVEGAGAGTVVRACSSSELEDAEDGEDWNELADQTLDGDEHEEASPAKPSQGES